MASEILPGCDRVKLFSWLGRFLPLVTSILQLARIRRDDGYDIMDYLSVHPHLGDLGDSPLFMSEANDRGIRVIIDLVVNYTSDQHPWFQAARRQDPKYHGYYVWRKDDQAIHRTKLYSRANNPASGGSTSKPRLTISIGFIRINRIQHAIYGARRDQRSWVLAGFGGFRISCGRCTFVAYGAGRETAT
jgi:hypothetical protein